MSKAPDLAAIFFALSDATRVDVVRRLGTGAALSATSLSEGANITRQAVVKHLQVLEGAGVVTHERRGREVLYTLEASALDEARVFLEGISAGWDRAIERLRRLVEEPEPTETTSPPPRKRRRPS